MPGAGWPHSLAVTRKRHKLPPAKLWPRSCEFLGRRAVVLLGVQCPVLAHGVAQQQILHRSRREIFLAVYVYDGAGSGLILVANRVI